MQTINNDFLEKGHLAFFYRPKVQLEKAQSPDDVQRFFLLLKPNRKSDLEIENSWLILIGKKHLPVISRHEKLYAFVYKTGEYRELLKYLEAKEYETVTRGHRHIQEARPCGYGVYGIIQKEKKTYLAYVLEIPEIPVTRGHRHIQEARPCGYGVYGIIQKEKKTYLACVLEIPEIPVRASLNIEKEGSYLLSIKNPEPVSDPETAGRIWKGLNASLKAQYSQELQENFQGKMYYDFFIIRFIPAIPVSYFDHQGCEILLIGITYKLVDKLNSFEHELQEWELKEVEKYSGLIDEEAFKELQLDKKKFKSDALLGRWV